MLSDQETILVYTPKPSPRLRYVLGVFFEQIVQARYGLTDGWEEFKSHSGPKIQYQAAGYNPVLPSAIHIPAGGNLKVNTNFSDIVVQQLFTGAGQQLKGESPVGLAYDFDVFAFCFYLLSQFELYHSGTKRDHLGRLPGSESKLFKAGLLQRPVVDELCLLLVDQIQQYWPGFPISFPTYQYRPTYDIDLSWAFKHRNPARQMGGIMKDLLKADLQKLRSRWRVARGIEKDPFDTFGYLDQLHQKYSLRPIYFFLLGDYGGLDRNISPGHPAQQALFRKLSQQHQCGIHPSIRSNQRPNQLARELTRFKNITGRTTTHSRQHYLVFNLPHTYRHLMAQGIQNDYSLGYADQPGFRSGMARPFPWYDLDLEQRTNLMLHPFVVMDQSLRRVVGKDHSFLPEKTLYFVKASKAVNGQFYSVWHNSSFSAIDGWQGWKANYELLIKQVT